MSTPIAHMSPVIPGSKHAIRIENNTGLSPVFAALWCIGLGHHCTRLTRRGVWPESRVNQQQPSDQYVPNKFQTLRANCPISNHPQKAHRMYRKVVELGFGALSRFVQVGRTSLKNTKPKLSSFQQRRIRVI